MTMSVYPCSLVQCCCNLTLPVQDGNGYIDRRELALMMRFSGESVSEEEIEEIINEADMDHNGLIDYTEFFMLMSPKR